MVINGIEIIRKKKQEENNGKSHLFGTIAWLASLTHVSNAESVFLRDMVGAEGRRGAPPPGQRGSNPGATGSGVPRP